ncbi:MAG TPA: M24 family metallopeptidase, partial [Thermoanaerobaculia bacterium]|nr:M24 family metallopeptidase [Thermoanaerobaculia bacterium]
MARRAAWSTARASRCRGRAAGRGGRCRALRAPRGTTAPRAPPQGRARALTHAPRGRSDRGGFETAREWLRPGVTERRVQVEMEAAFFRAGADATGYDSIVGSGPNSAVLHFSPGARELRAGEPVLIDAGAAVAGYTADVT